MFSPLGDSMFIMPVCYHPTTLLTIDDEEAFSRMLAMELQNDLALLSFNTPESALEYAKKKHRYLPFTSRCIIEEHNNITLKFSAIRDEIFNPCRFKEINISVTDYDMPNLSGIEVIKSMEFAPEISRYSRIILTGKISNNFKKKIAEINMSNSYIGKDDPEYVAKLLALVKKSSEKIFQWYSYTPARILSKNPNELTSFLFDGNFSKLFNEYIEKHHICEFYLFDQQGSYLFLDKHANFSWLFVRNDKGVENTSKLAMQYGAPQKIIDAIKSKKFILSLYEEQDFKARKSIDWEKYLLPATVFESNSDFLSFFPNLIDNDSVKPQYYYSFTTEFPDHGIKRDQVLSYDDFLDDQE